MDISEALRRANATFGATTTFETREAALERDAVPTAIVVTGELAFEQALALHREARARRAEVGLVPLIVTTEALAADVENEDGEDVAVNALASASADAFFEERAAGEDLEAQIEASLDLLGAAAGRDPLSILHRVDAYALEALEVEGEPIDFDDLSVPDDVREAYHQGLVERAAFLEEVRRQGLGRARIEPLRTYDEDTALAELCGGPARVALIASTPAQALAHLGFGGFNACPRPRVHASVWERWERLHGAEPVVVGTASIAGFLRRPGETRAGLVALAREIILYDRDVLSAGLLAFLGQLYRNTSIGFWWD